MSISNKILIPFDLLVDVDIGLMSILRKNFYNKKYVNINLLFLPDKIMIYELLNHDNINPVKYIMNEEYIDSADNIYEEFMRDYYDDILKESITTSIFELVKVYIMTSSIKVTILCKNQQEELFIKELLKEKPYSYSILVSEYKDIDVNQYDSIFFKDYTKVLDIKDLYGKNIYIAKYLFNLDSVSSNTMNIPKREISSKIGDTNIVYTIDVYSADKYIKPLG